MATSIDIAHLQSRQVKDAGQVLGRAFFDDPVFIWTLPNEAKRQRALPRFMTSMTRYGQLLGDVYTAGGSPEGAAIWFPAEKSGTSIVGMIRSGMLISLLRMGLPSAGRFMGAIDHLDTLHKRDMPPAHWYLAVLGVDPPRQGQGVGSALMTPVLSSADAEALPCYLETARERNLPFYHRHGFEVIVEGDLPKGGPHFWTMKREPRR